MSTLAELQRQKAELEKQIETAIKDGSLKWNMDMLNMFDRGFLICDEIHSVYNSSEKNNWGVAIQMVLNYWKNRLKTKLQALKIQRTP